MPRLKIALILVLALTACAPLASQAPAPAPTSAPAALAPSAVPPTVAVAANAAPTIAPQGGTATAASTSTPQAAVKSAAPTQTSAPSATPQGGAEAATADTRLPPDQWKDWPVLPVVSAHAKALYQAGLAAGNNPRAFSKIGDCQNITSHFLGAFDSPQTYLLGPKFASLQPAIDQFKGMYARESASVRNGFNVAAVLSPMQADPAVCKSGENPVSCELRLNKPSIVVISMETWWAKKPADEYEKYMRQILDLVIAAKAMPVLATKADNLEGDFSINAALAKLAYEYDIPLWNFWKAVQPLPNGGLSEDGFHLSHDSLDPSDPLFYRRLSEEKSWDYGWTVRNVTALQAIDTVWRQASGK
jgi:hypothetical protein